MNPIDLRNSSSSSSNTVRTAADVKREIKTLNSQIKTCQQTIDQLSSQLAHARTPALKNILSDKKVHQEGILLTLQLDLVRVTQFANSLLQQTQGTPVQQTPERPKPITVKPNELHPPIFCPVSPVQPIKDVEIVTVAKEPKPDLDQTNNVISPPTTNPQPPSTPTPNPQPPKRFTWISWKSLLFMVTMIGGSIFIYRNWASILMLIRKLLNMSTPEKQKLPEPPVPSANLSKPLEAPPAPQQPPLPSPTKPISNKEMKQHFKNYAGTILQYIGKHNLDWMVRHKKITQELCNWIIANGGFNKVLKKHG